VVTSRAIREQRVSNSVFSPSTVVVTGGAGFIGSNLIRWILERAPGVVVVNLDALTYAGNLENLSDVTRRFGWDGERRYFFLHGDIRDGALVSAILSGNARDPATGRPTPVPDAIFHLAAETHVDRSILGATEFVSSNVQGTLTLLASTLTELETRPRDFRFVSVSTDEVYGSLSPQAPGFTEEHPLRPNSPYAATKAGSDCLVRAYTETHGLPCLTTRCSNNYGPYQFPEKLIPLMITRALRNEPLPVYGDGQNVRDWLFVNDHAHALWTVCTRGHLRDAVYNIGGEAEVPNVDVVRGILGLLGKPESLLRFVDDRPGHDRRYAMDITRIRSVLGWQPSLSFAAGLEQTVAWYVDHEDWWQRVLSEAYRISQAHYLHPSTA
jgi:dTDP-glucose 4,6-dehydratase